MQAAPMSAEHYDSNDLTKDELSDDAIELLYDVVRRAQSSPDQSSRALFSAYEEVLGEYGLGPEDDGVIHRFLFRMQRNRVREEGLVQRFRRVLAEIGIYVEVNEDGEGVEVTTEIEGVTKGGQSHAGSVLDARQERRKSFDSFLDGSADKIAGTTDVGLDLPFRSRRGSLDVSRNTEIERWQKRRTWSDTEAQSSYHHQLPIRTKGSGHRGRRTASEQHRPTHRRSGSVSSRGSLQIWRSGRSQASQIGEYDADDSEQTADLDLSNIQIPGVNAPIPDSHPAQVRRYVREPYIPEPYRPSDTRLMDDAETFEMQRLHSLARGYLLKWRNLTRDRIERNEEMVHAAIVFDRRVLLKASIGTLREAMEERRLNQETERFFERLERRAEKARSLFLLTKAFTHWAKSAEDEVQRTSVARRHILRTKFFNGWREITAVNELKIQHFVLGKFLELWRRRTAEVRGREDLAVQIYDVNLVQKCYKDWLFRHYEIAAAARYEARLKRDTFGKWHEITTLIRNRDSWAIDRKEREIIRKTLRVWREKLTAFQGLHSRAEELGRRTLLTTTLSTLQKHTQFAPRVAQFRAKANARLVQSAFQTWQQSANLSRQARRIDQMRILRNAWTTWNDRLRIKALEERINDRVLVEAMYKWTLASRVSLFQRVHDRNLKQSILLTWVTKANDRSNTLESAERRFAQFKQTQLLRSCLRKMESATAEKRAEEFAVIAEYEQKLKLRVFTKLLDKHAQLQQLNTWAGDARFYVLSTRTIKAWNEATQHARRNRRREAYAQIRRTVKLNVVKKAFSVWKGKTEVIQENDHQATQLARARTLEIGQVLLSRWNNRTLTLVNQDHEASQHYTTKLQIRSLQTWIQRLAAIQTMDTQAIALRQESTEIAAASALKKLGWRLWNVQRQEENAFALHQRNFEKHRRAMLRFWYEQMVERTAGRAGSPSPGVRQREGGEDGNGDVNPEGYQGSEGSGENERQDEAFDNVGDETRRLEGWTAFDEGALGLSNLDLSFSISPQSQSLALPSEQPLLPQPQPSASRPPHRRPQTYPQPSPALRPPPPIPEDLAFNDPTAFWTSTPMPVSKPGYLKTPSKRSVARSKRPELAPAGSPEKRTIRLVKERDIGRGVMSAPPRSRGFVGEAGEGGMGVTSFQRRLREGGFGGQTDTVGKGRVGFWDV